MNEIEYFRLLEEITDEELKSQENPTFKEQNAEWCLILSEITFENVKQLLNGLNYNLLTFRHFNETNGVINQIYLLQAQQFATHSNVELILRVSNPHKFWKYQRTKSEVAVMKHLKENTNIPIPKIISYAINIDNPLKCEYILMEKLPGKELGKVVAGKRSVEIPDKIIDQMINVIKELHMMKPIWKYDIGCFDLNMQIDSYIWDGHTLGPFKDFFDFLNQYLLKTITEMRKLSKYVLLAEKLNICREHLNEKLQQNRSSLSYDDELVIVHGDLNASNILIDDNSMNITGILDWEFASFYHDDFAFKFFESWLDDVHEKEIMKNRIELRLQKETDWFRKPKGEFIRGYFKEVINTSSQLSFYSSSWFKSNNVDLEIRMHIDKHARDLNNMLLKWNYYVDKI